MYLSEKQIQILELKAQGKTNKQIAYDLGVSDSTVRTHLLKAYRTLGVNSAAQAVAKWMSNDAQSLISRVYSLSDDQIALVVDHLKSQGPPWAQKLSSGQLRVLVMGVNESMTAVLQEKI